MRSSPTTTKLWHGILVLSWMQPDGKICRQSMEYKWSISAFHNARGRLFLKSRETERAFHEFESARKIAAFIKSNDNLAYSLFGLGSVAASRGNTREAERLKGQGRGIFRQICHRCALGIQED